MRIKLLSALFLIPGIASAAPITETWIAPGGGINATKSKVIAPGTTLDGKFLLDAMSRIDANTTAASAAQTTANTGVTNAATAQSAAEAAQTTASAAIPLTQKGAASGVAPLDDGARVSSAISSPYGSFVGGKSQVTTSSAFSQDSGLLITDPGKASWSGVGTLLNFSGYDHELTVQAFAGASNMLSLMNLDQSGYSAITAQQYDMHRKVMMEHGAFGWGSQLSWGASEGYDFIEASCFDKKNDPLCPAAPFTVQQSGGQFANYSDYYAILTAGSTQVTLLGGGSWPSGINGKMFDAPWNYGAFPDDTTIVSGAGTATLTLSSPSLVTTSDASLGTPVVYGSPTAWQQEETVFWTPKGNIDWYGHNCMVGGAVKCTPLASFERIHNRVGILTTNPVTPLDVIGSATFGIDSYGTANRAYYAGAGVINELITPGDTSGQGTLLSVNGLGSSLFQVQWAKNSSPSTTSDSIDFKDIGGNISVAKFHLNSSGQFQFTATTTRAISGDFTPSVSECGETLIDSALSNVTFPSNLPAGCMIRVIQSSNNSVSLSSGSGMTLQGVLDGVSYTFGSINSSATVLYTSKTTAVVIPEAGRVTRSDASATNMLVGGTLVIPFGTPASSTATCTKGQLEMDATYLYSCVATNTWNRLANGATW